MTIFIARDMSDRESNVMLLILSVQNDNKLYKIYDNDSYCVLVKPFKGSFSC